MVLGQWGGKRAGAGRKKRALLSVTTTVISPGVLPRIDVLSGPPRQTTRMQIAQQQQQQQQPLLEQEEPSRGGLESQQLTAVTTTTTTKKVRGRHGGYRPGAGRKKKINGKKVSTKKRRTNGHVVVAQSAESPLEATATATPASLLVTSGDTGMATTTARRLMPLMNDETDDSEECVLGELFNTSELQELLNLHHDECDNVHDNDCARSTNSNLDHDVQQPLAIADPKAEPTETRAAVAATAAAAKKPVVNIRCFYWPCCTNNVSVCGGRRRNTCKMVNSGIITLPLDFDYVKKSANRKYMATYEAERWQRRKTATQLQQQQRNRNRNESEEEPIIIIPAASAASVPIRATTTAVVMAKKAAARPSNNNGPRGPLVCEPCNTTAVLAQEGLIDHKQHELAINSVVAPKPPRLDAIQEPAMVAVGAAAATTETSAAAAAAAAAADTAVAVVSIRCFYWPCCTNDASVCGGTRRNKCKLVNSGSIVLPFDFENVKKRAMLKEKAKYAAKRYAAVREKAKLADAIQSPIVGAAAAAAAAATATSPERRAVKCFYWPCCTNDASVCGGTRRNKCRAVNGGSVQLPCNFEDVKKSAKLKEDAKYSAERYAMQKAKRQQQINDKEQEESLKEPVRKSLAKPIKPAVTAVAKKVPPLNSNSPDLAYEPCNTTTGLTQELIERGLAINSPVPNAPPAVQPPVVATDDVCDGHTLEAQQTHPQFESRKEKVGCGHGGKQAGAGRKQNTISSPVATPEQTFAQQEGSLLKADNRNVDSRAFETEQNQQRQQQLGPQLVETLKKKRKCGHGGKHVGAGRKRKKVAEQASAPAQAFAQQEVVDRGSCVDSRTLETEQPQKLEPQFVTKVSVCGHGGKRPGAGRKRKRIPEQASALGQPILQQEQHSVQVENGNTDASSVGDMHMFDAERQQQQQQQQQLEPRLATTRKMKVGGGHGGKRAGAERKKKQLRGPASLLEPTIAQHQTPSLLHPTNSNTESAIDPMTALGAEHKLHPQESEERILDERLPDILAEPVIASEIQGESETTNTVDTGMPLNGTVPETQGQSNNGTVEKIMPSNDPDRASMNTVEKVTTLNDSNRDVDLSIKAGTAKTPKHDGELTANLVGQHAPTRDKVQLAAAATASPSRSATATVLLRKKCVYWPCCRYDASVCGGHHRNACKSVRSGRVVLPSNFEDVKLVAKREVRRKYAAWLRAAKKLPKQKSKRQRHAQPVHQTNTMSRSGHVAGRSSTLEQAITRQEDDFHLQADNDNTERRGVLADVGSLEAEQQRHANEPPNDLDDHFLESLLGVNKPPQEFPEHELTMAANSVGLHAAPTYDKVQQPAMATTATTTKSPFFENVTTPPPRTTTNTVVVFRKRCFYWPCCTDDASVCGGHHRNACQAVESGRVELPSNFEHVKRSATREARRKYIADKRAVAKKKQRKNKKKVTRRYLASVAG